MIAVVLACTLVSLSTSATFETRKVVQIPLKMAIQNPGLVLAMFQQLDPGFLNNNQHYYIVRVYYGYNIYEISGTYEQWVRFFELKWKLLLHEDKPVNYR